jgi:hypothetical protein
MREKCVHGWLLAVTNPGLPWGCLARGTARHASPAVGATNTLQQIDKSQHRLATRAVISLLSQQE